MSQTRILDRYGVSATAECVWQQILNDPAITTASLSRGAACSQSEVAACLDELTAAHLVRVEGEAPCGHIANDPRAALENLAVRAERQVATELAHIASLRSQISGLADIFEAGRTRAGILPGFDVVTSIEDIRQQIYAEAERNHSELRTLHHNVSAQAILDGLEIDKRAVQRGVRLRTIARPSDLDMPGLYQAFKSMHEVGEEIRVMESVPTLMQIMDDRLAVVRLDPNDTFKGAMFIRVQNLVDLLIDLYERMWEDAEPLFPSGRCEPDLSARQAELLSLVARGTKDEAIARSLGIGVRTIRRDISGLKELTGATSRTELITAAIRRGWV
jgi:DNA-binding CsgD family transcriptional regulator